VLGFLTALIAYRKTHNRFYWITTVTLLFMLVWRLACHSLMLSTRYSSIFLYPAIISTAWFCFYLPKLISMHRAFRLHRLMNGSSFLNNHPVPPQHTFIPTILITGLAIACLTKILHYNAYRAGIMELCKKSNLHRGNDPAYYYHNSKEKSRILFYTTTSPDKEHDFPLLINGSNGLLQNIQEAVVLIQNIQGKHFFFLQQPASDKSISSADLQIKGSDGSWEALGQVFTSQKKKNKNVLYCYTPLTFPNIEKWDDDISRPEKDNLLENGDFETILSEEKNLERVKELSKHGFITQPGISYPFPDVWWQSIDDWKKGTAPVIKLVSDNPLSGKYSLLIDSEQSSYLGTINSLSFPMAKEYEVDFFAKNIGTKEAKLSFYVCSWNTNPYTFSRYRLFRLRPEQVYKICLPVSKKVFPGFPSFYFSIRVQGKVLLDNVTVSSKE